MYFTIFFFASRFKNFHDDSALTTKISDFVWSQILLFPEFKNTFRANFLNLFLLYLNYKCISFFSEPIASFGQCDHQLWTSGRFYQDWPSWNSSSSSRRCVSTPKSKSSHLAFMHRCPWSFLQKYQIYCWMSCWRAD